jgi:TrmH family RNA methyltransferase
MLTNKQIKLINSLHTKKGRKESDLFLVEGEKGIDELLSSNYPIKLIVLNESLTNIPEVTANTEIYMLPQEELTKLSSLTTNSYGFAIVQSKFYEEDEFSFHGQMSVVLDGVRDPGNLGTIIRICDWYGITQLILSEDCTEFYNPKVISASMGSFHRIKFLYTDLPKFFTTHSTTKVLGATLEGQSIYSYSFPKNGFILMGNESLGIRESILTYISDHVTIPRIGEAESLNVAISTGIILDNFRRSHFPF